MLEPIQPCSNQTIGALVSACTSPMHQTCMSLLLYEAWKSCT